MWSLWMNWSLCEQLHRLCYYVFCDQLQYFLPLLGDKVSVRQRSGCKSGYVTYRNVKVAGSQVGSRGKMPPLGPRRRSPRGGQFAKKTIYEQQGHIRNFYRRPVASSGHRVRVHELKQKWLKFLHKYTGRAKLNGANAVSFVVIKHVFREFW